MMRVRRKWSKAGELLTLWKDGQREWYNFMLIKKDRKRMVESYMDKHSLTNELMGVVENVMNSSISSKKKISKKNNKINMKKPPSQQNESVLPRQLDAVLCGSEYNNLVIY
jgi:hypothetical protein